MEHRITFDLERDSFNSYPSSDALVFVLSGDLVKIIISSYTPDGDWSEREFWIKREVFKEFAKYL